MAKGGVAPIVAKNAEVVVLGEGFGFTEGPATDHFGNVSFTDQPNDKIYRWDRRGRGTVHRRG